jgi:cytochrome c-type biogenesis protein CcmF
VFVLGAVVETSGRVEAAQALGVGQTLRVGAYTLSLDSVAPVDGPNYSADRATIRVIGPHGPAATMTPERRFYPANRQSTSQVAISARGASDLYVVLGEQRSGPLLMALGGLVSLSDRRLRIAAGAKARAKLRAGAEVAA